MPRIARIVIPHCPHHITQRGNHQDVFFVDDDRHAYLDLLEQRCTAAAVPILGYCLMTNHVHLLAVPPTEHALAHALGRTHFLYSQYINRLHGRSGHLWQNRFYSCALDEPHLWAALRYLERNPVRAGLVRTPWQYRWSSAAAHVGEHADHAALLNLDLWAANWTPKGWRDLLREPLPDDEATRVRTHLCTGRPLAADAFLAKLERRLGRRLRPLPVGRPRQTAPPRARKSRKLPRQRP